MRAARRQGVLGVVRCVTGPSSRVRACTPSVRHLLRGGYKRGLHVFEGEQRHHGRFGAPDEKNGGGGDGGSNRRRVSLGDIALGHGFIADDARVVLQIPEQLRKVLNVIVVVCAAFGLIVSEAKTEIIYLRTERGAKATTIFSVEAAD